MYCNYVEGHFLVSVVEMRRAELLEVLPMTDASSLTRDSFYTHTREIRTGMHAAAHARTHVRTYARTHALARVDAHSDLLPPPSRKEASTKSSG